MCENGSEGNGGFVDGNLLEEGNQIKQEILHVLTCTAQTHDEKRDREAFERDIDM